MGISNLLWSYWYNRNDAYMKHICEDIISKIQGKHNVSHHDDTDIIYGYLVISFGDYGTSPRYGWIDDDKKDDIIKEIKQFIEEIKED